MRFVTVFVRPRRPHSVREKPDVQDSHQVETRRKRRYAPTQTIQVIDAFTGNELGSLVNITCEGMMLVSAERIEPNRIYQINLQLPETIKDTNSIDVVIDCLWSKHSGSQEVYWAGCAIIDSDEHANNIIEELIASYGE